LPAKAASSILYILAVLLYDDSYSYDQIAKILLLNDEAIRQHVNQYHEVSKLKPTNGGSYGKLSKEQETELVSRLESNNYVYAKEIAGHIFQNYGEEDTVVGGNKIVTPPRLRL
jgi:transposase